MSARSARLTAAIDRLAGLYEHGHLLAESTPEELLAAACDEIERARGVAPAAPAGLQAAVEAALPCRIGKARCVPPRSYGQSSPYHHPACAAARVPAVLAALARFRWESAAEAVRLRVRVQGVVDGIEAEGRVTADEIRSESETGPADYLEGRRLGRILGMTEVRTRLQAALAAPPAPGAAALAKLSALPAKILNDHPQGAPETDDWVRRDTAKEIADQLAALLRAAGVEATP